MSRSYIKQQGIIFVLAYESAGYDVKELQLRYDDINFELQYIVLTRSLSAQGKTIGETIKHIGDHLLNAVDMYKAINLPF